VIKLYPRLSPPTPGRAFSAREPRWDDRPVDGIVVSFQFGLDVASVRLMPGREGNYNLAVQAAPGTFPTVVSIPIGAFEALTEYHRQREG